MDTDLIRVGELPVGLPDVTVLGVEDEPGGPIRVHIETREPRPLCPSCGVVAGIKDRPRVELVDLPVFRNYRIRALLYAGKPNWKLLATITPR